jgi:hypothetical protein
MSALAHKPREDYELTDVERIATGLIACVEGLRDKQISPKAARVSAEMFLAQLDTAPIPVTVLYVPTHLLADVCKRWAAIGCDVPEDFLILQKWKKIALDTVDLVQTTMAREAGRMP